MDPNDLLFLLLPKKRFFGLTVAVFVKRADQAAAFAKVEQALQLIQDYAPKRFAQIQADVRQILVCGDPSAQATWDKEARRIEVEDNYLCSNETSVAEIASALVHEAEHARLHRLGFGYEEPLRLYIERVCFRAQRVFARRLPDGEALAAEADRMRDLITDADYSNAAFHRRKMDALREMGCPDWILGRFERRFRKRGNGMKREEGRETETKAV